MTTDEYDAGPKLEKLTENLQKAEALTERLVGALARRKPHDPSLNGSLKSAPG